MSKINIIERINQNFDTISLSKYGRIHTNKDVLSNDKLSKYINDEMMGALDNYANHEDMDIFISTIKPNDKNDIDIKMIYKNKNGTRMDNKFGIKSPENDKDITRFFRELYKKIHKISHAS